jgi:signal transduction histidine kinase
MPTHRKLSQDELEDLLEAQEVSADMFTSAPDAYFLDLLASIDREVLTPLISEEQYAPGEVIFKEGAAGDAMYLLRSGRTAVVRGDFEQPLILGYRGPGEIIGEMALLEQRPRSASIIAVDDVRTLKIKREHFQELLNYNPEISLSVMATLSSRLRAADTARDENIQAGRQLTRQVSDLKDEKQQLLEVQTLRDETGNFIIHDLRNPLGIINGVIQMLEMVLPEEILDENRELLDAGKAAAGHMHRLVESLLDVSRIEAGEDQIEPVSTDLRRLIAKAIQRVTPEMTLSDISLTTEIDEALPQRVLLDREKIDRVLTNLLDNAVKYTPSKGHIQVTAERRDDQIALSVDDSGPGIPPEERERIFERFAQVKGRRARRRGFGLGLTFCQLAVEGHGGRIWVEPGADDIGSRFVFTLPLVEPTPS